MHFGKVFCSMCVVFLVEICTASSHQSCPPGTSPNNGCDDQDDATDKGVCAVGEFYDTNLNTCTQFNQEMKSVYPEIIRRLRDKNKFNTLFDTIKSSLGLLLYDAVLHPERYYKYTSDNKSELSTSDLKTDLYQTLRHSESQNSEQDYDPYAFISLKRYPTFKSGAVNPYLYPDIIPFSGSDSINNRSDLKHSDSQILRHSDSQKSETDSDPALIKRHSQPTSDPFKTYLYPSISTRLMNHTGLDLPQSEPWSEVSDPFSDPHLDPELYADSSTYLMSKANSDYIYEEDSATEDSVTDYDTVRMWARDYSMPLDIFQF